MNPMNRWMLMIGCWVLVAGLVGCESSGEGEGSSGSRVPTAEELASRSTYELGLLVNTLDARKLGYSLRWASGVEIGASSKLEYVVEAGEMVLCVERPTNVMTAISMEDGRLLWSTVVGQAGDRLFPPARRDKEILINSETRLFIFSAETGILKRSDALDGTVNGGPVVVSNFAIFRGVDHRVFAHDLDAGFMRWAYMMTDRIWVQPAVSGPNVFVADGNGVCAVLSSTAGELQWKTRIFARVSAQPAVSPQGVFVASEDHSLYAMNRATGRDRWIYRTTQMLVDAPSVVENMVLLPLPGHGVAAIDERTGREMWRLQQDARFVARRGDALIFSQEGGLLAVEADTGLIGSMIPVGALKTILLGSEEQVILVSPEGRLQRFDPLS